MENIIDTITNEIERSDEYGKVMEFIAKVIQWFFSGDIFQITGRILLLVIAIMIIRIIFYAIAAIFCVFSDANEIKRLEENRERNLNGKIDSANMI